MGEKERCEIAALRGARVRMEEIAEQVGRHRSTIYREVVRNRSRHDGKYRAQRAEEMTRGRRSRSRRNERISQEEWKRVEELLRQEWSPEQISGHLKSREKMKISPKRIYQYVWANKKAGGSLHEHLRGARKQRRKRYARKDSRGRLAGKRPITERPASVERRRRKGHWEIDTVLGGRAKDCILTMVERKTGYLLIGKLKARTSDEAAKSTLKLINAHEGKVKTITADNGTEFHGYAQIEERSAVKFYFATPHHSWERGTNENTNGLIRQYLPKRQSMAKLTQFQCDQIALKINLRPRKRLNFKNPYECFFN
jgi:transposase, IS30 family